MKRYFLTTIRHVETVWPNLLLVAVLLSSTALVGARNSTKQTEVEPTAVGAAATLSRNDALTSVPGQGIAVYTSKQNSVKHPVSHVGLSPRESGVPANTVHELLVTTYRSILYLSFRSSRPGGRAPPALA